MQHEWWVVGHGKPGDLESDGTQACHEPETNPQCKALVPRVCTPALPEPQHLETGVSSPLYGRPNLVAVKYLHIYILLLDSKRDDVLREAKFLHKA